MKKMLIGTMATLALLPGMVKADGFATLSVVGEQNSTVGENVEVKVVVDDVRETYKDKGIVSVGADLVFDNEYLEYVGVEKATEPYEFKINEKIFRIAGLDFTLANGIKEETVIYTFKFKALKEGNTNITFKNAKLTDTKTYADVTVNGMDVNISKKVEEVPVVTTEPTTTTTTTTTTTVRPSTTINTTKETTKTTTTTSAITEEPTTEIIVENLKADAKDITVKTKKVNVLTKIINFFRNIFR